MLSCIILNCSDGELLIVKDTLTLETVIIDNDISTYNYTLEANLPKLTRSDIIKVATRNPKFVFYNMFENMISNGLTDHFPNLNRRYLRAHYDKACELIDNTGTIKSIFTSIIIFCSIYVKSTTTSL